MRTVEIIIDRKGGVKLETKGFVGADCAKATKEIEAAIGEVVSDRKTPAYFETAKVGQTVSQGS